MILPLTVFDTLCLGRQADNASAKSIGTEMVWCEPSTWAWRNWHISQMENQFFFSCICYILLCSEIDDFLYTFIHTSYTYNSYIIIICFCALVFGWLQFNWIGIYKLENVINIETVELIILCLFLHWWLRLLFLSMCSTRISGLLEYLSGWRQERRHRRQSLWASIILCCPFYSDRLKKLFIRNSLEQHSLATESSAICLIWMTQYPIKLILCSIHFW